jgi:hypothetical protein
LTQPADTAEQRLEQRGAEGGEAGRTLRKPGETQSAWDAYMASCTDYIKRQVIVYQNWPQRRYDPTGYRKEKVFSDMNN